MGLAYIRRIYQHFLEEVGKQTLKEGIDVAWKAGIFYIIHKKPVYTSFINEGKCSSLLLVGILNHPVGSKYYYHLFPH